jgi:hypothetical protein
MASTPRTWPVDFDPEKIPAGAVRPLTELERAALWIYLEKIEELSQKSKNGREVTNYPRPHLFDGIFRRKIYQTMKDSGAFDGIGSFDDRKALVRKETDQLFRGLFFDGDGRDLRESLTSSDIIRRIGGLGNIFYTDDDLITTIKAIDAELTRTQDGYVPGTVTFRQAVSFSDAHWIVPGINIVCPHPSTILDRFTEAGENRLWINILEQVFDTDVERQRQRKAGFTLNDLQRDYSAFTHELRAAKGDNAYLAQTADFEARSHSDVYAIRADEYMKVLHTNNMTLDDLRESLGFERLKPTKGPPRKEKIAWSDSGKKSHEEVQDAIMHAYIKAWGKAHGRSVNTDDEIRNVITQHTPPRKADLDSFCRTITEKTQTARLTEEDIVPSQTMIHEYFGGVNPLLARIEQHYGVEVCLDNHYQLTSLAAVAKPKDPNKPALSPQQVPQRVRERVFEI